MRFEGDIVKRYINSFVIVPSFMSLHCTAKAVVFCMLMFYRHSLCLFYRSVASQSAEYFQHMSWCSKTVESLCNVSCKVSAVMS